MGKIIIVDDRVERKKQFLSPDELEILRGYEGKQWLEMPVLLPHDSQLEDFKSWIDDCTMIAIHRTGLVESSWYNEVVEYTAGEKKKLIIFSGGIGQTLLLNGEQRLMINASNFYTKDLIPFIERYCNEEMEHPLLQFLYGAHWRLPLLLQYRHALWLSGDEADLESNERRIDNYRLIFHRNDLPENTIENEMVWVNREINKETVNL